MISKQEFEKLFRELYPDLLRYAFALTGELGKSEDIIQEIFLTLWESHEKVIIQTSVHNYLFKAVKFRCLNYLQRDISKKYQHIEWNQISEPAIFPNIDSNIHQFAREAIYSLPDRCKTIFLLSRFTNLTYKEIAIHLDISVKTVETQMSIALSKIKQFLSERGVLEIVFILLFINY